ncbi:hypothetical protein Chor_015445 [Crotalus horridus]
MLFTHIFATFFRSVPVGLLMKRPSKRFTLSSSHREISSKEGEGERRRSKRRRKEEREKEGEREKKREEEEERRRRRKEREEKGGEEEEREKKKKVEEEEEEEEGEGGEREKIKEEEERRRRREKEEEREKKEEREEKEDSTTYAHFLFNAFDTDHNGSVSFEDFVMGLSILLRGTVQEKLNWAFNLYDINKDGYITKEEMLDIMKAIYDMMGKCTYPVLQDDAPRQHVETFFQKMDRNKDGVVTIDEFIESCQKVSLTVGDFSAFLSLIEPHNWNLLFCCSISEILGDLSGPKHLSGMQSVCLL